MNHMQKVFNTLLNNYLQYLSADTEIIEKQISSNCVKAQHIEFKIRFKLTINKLKTDFKIFNNSGLVKIMLYPPQFVHTELLTPRTGVQGLAPGTGFRNYGINCRFHAPTTLLPLQKRGVELTKTKLTKRRSHHLYKTLK